MRNLSRLAFAVLLSTTVTLGCSGDGSSNNPGTGGTGGADPSFMAVAPCSTEASYTTTTVGRTSIMFPNSDNSYAPRCLKVIPAATVTFVGDFGSHPLRASIGRGTLTANPIAVTDGGGMDNGTTATFTFPAPGFYAYFCLFHGQDPAGTGMTGVIWVK